jgi:predicted RNA-binding Zn ribbon-like protein
MQLTTYPCFTHVIVILLMHDTTSQFPLERWPLRGGVPCLDLANTEAYRATGHEMDLLQSYDMVVAWSLAAGALRPGEAGPLLRAAAEAPDSAARHLAQMRELRSAIRVVMQSVALRTAPPVAALATLNAFLAESQVHGQIVRSNGGFELRFRPEDDMALPIWRLTDSAARLLLSPERENVRECPGHECGWLFLDTTKNHSRRWCDSADCGNRARVRAYSQRKRGAARA